MPQSYGIKLGINEIYPEVKLKDKVEIIEKLLSGKDMVVMVGDQVNGAAALTKADVGIAMGYGAGIAKEAADSIYRRRPRALHIQA